MSNKLALASVDRDKLPQHLAVIMDGNGRWASDRGMPRTFGHKQGVEATKRLVTAARDVGIEHLTIYGFSTENWARPKDEVDVLMGLLKSYFNAEISELHRANIRIRVIGNKGDFSRDIAALLDRSETLTAQNSGMTLCVALSYGGRNEIVASVQSLAARVAAGELAADEITAHMVATGLETADLPDPDLIIRTSGEQRLSNFLLWQAAYAELYFDPVLWPDYSAEHLATALNVFANRERRFGGLKAQTAL
ncbi:isoprenyl transferase [Alphaproteobacteria bacterium]|jgi:undecaprenyl diphosphate synthase|nr:isoprenyl transferase [Alphaproteobacteria bacterium]